MATTADYGGGIHTTSISPTFATRSPDTISPIYPERAIRPLPKSRLKNKLSPQQVGSIVYPPDPPPISPTLRFGSIPENGLPSSRMINSDTHHHHHEHEEELQHNHCTCGEDHGDSGDEVEFDHPDYRYSTGTSPAMSGNGKPLDSVQRRLMEASRVPSKPPPPGSTASSADGYESFENTNNKKKRKIPVSAASSMHQSQLSQEMANLGISSPDGNEHSSGQHASTSANAASGTGISGAGRGRYGRQGGRAERRPLTSTTINAVNGYGSRHGSWGGSEAKDCAGGIISQAIKTAAEQGPLTPQKGQDHGISLLQSAASNSSSTPKTQFTFSCESESASKMIDQHSIYGSPSPAGSTMPQRQTNGQPHSTKNTQGTQTNPSTTRQAPLGSNARPPPLSSHQSGQPPAPAPKPKTRRRPSKEYALAARQRQLQQEYTNYHHRPSKDSMYICEFCEYEDIFGEPPMAMIRAYEIKDRQERKKAAEKRRLLEKAKMKNRKGKKGKNGKNNGGNNNHAMANPPTDGHGAQGGQHYDPNMAGDGDEYFEDDEYGDEYEPGDGDPYDDPQDLAYYPPTPPSGGRSGIHPPASTPATVTPSGGGHSGTMITA